MENLRIVVAGHIDHGKSTVIGRVLYETNSLPGQTEQVIKRKNKSSTRENEFAFITDQLEEEKAKGITIDTTEALIKAKHRQYTFIDTPGHKQFLKNMLTGATRADAGILVVDAAEGMMDQTYQHAYLMGMLGIRELVVVINKMDLINYNKMRFWELSEQVSECLQKLRFQIIGSIPVSAKKGDNIAGKRKATLWYNGSTLTQLLDYFSNKKNLTQKPLRFLVQCSLQSNNGIRILGKVVSGKLFRNHRLTFGPVYHVTEVLSIESGSQLQTSAEAGECVSVILKDPGKVERGQVGFNVCQPPIITDCPEAEIFWIGSDPLKAGDNIEILCGTDQKSGSVQRISQVVKTDKPDVDNCRIDQVDESRTGIVRIKLESPVCVDFFESIAETGCLGVIRNGKITGGGIIKQ